LPLFGLYIFHETGQLLFSKDFPHEELEQLRKTNPNLISGLMSALGTFSASIGGGSIRKIQMENFAILGIKSPKYCTNFLAICDVNDSHSQINALLKKCRASFTRKYAKSLKVVNSGRLVNNEEFSEWAEKLENILNDFDLTSIQSLMTSIVASFRDVLKEQNE